MARDMEANGPSAWAKTAERIREELPAMKAIHKKIALHILEDPQSVIFSSIQSLGESIGVSEATIVRFTRSLGFSGFTDFKREIQESIKLQLNPYEKIALGELHALAKNAQLQKLSHYEIENLRKTYHDLDVAAIEAIVEAMKQTDQIFMCGFGVSHHIVAMYEFLFSANTEKPFLAITGSVADYISRLSRFRKGDVLVVMTMPPYSREAVQVAKFARARKGRVFLITDSPRCPVYAVAEGTILIANTSLLFTNSYVGHIAVLQTIMNMLLLSNPRLAIKRMKHLEDLEIQGSRDLSTLDRS
jgi:DNA-binding MurR/RpiR family transcriptional regulator